MKIKPQWDALTYQPPKSPILGRLPNLSKSPILGDLGGGSGRYLIATPLLPVMGIESLLRNRDALKALFKLPYISLGRGKGHDLAKYSLGMVNLGVVLHEL
ncbi:MAG: hypothetical protein KME11_11000 [Timaviella obliquedivisa GSE-PSE-MK23-08B]|nr:hypothetical protein [Timaviella obliquedivisa GSE-PSE-MK23-08B]